MVRPRARLAPAHRHTQRALLWHRRRMLDFTVQLLWLERDQVRERDRPELNRYVQDARDLDCQPVAGLGNPYVAHLALAGRRVRAIGLWHRA